MMREALANLDDLPRVKRILLELGRFYNPVTDRPVVGLDTRRAVVISLEAGDLAGARGVLDAHLAEYLEMDAAGPKGPALRETPAGPKGPALREAPAGPKGPALQVTR